MGLMEKKVETTGLIGVRVEGFRVEDLLFMITAWVQGPK